MDFEQAMKVVTEICVNYRGTLQEHQTIQQALALVRQGKAVEEQKKTG